jgi:hypothetical protein
MSVDDIEDSELEEKERQILTKLTPTKQPTKVRGNLSLHASPSHPCLAKRPLARDTSATGRVALSLLRGGDGRSSSRISFKTELFFFMIACQETNPSSI